MALMIDGPSDSPWLARTLLPDEAAARLTLRGAEAWPQALPVIEALLRHGHEAWVVGGSVRDLLLERSGGDADLATDASPERMMEILPHPVPTGLRHGTVTAIVGDHPVQVTTFRTDQGYSDARRPDRVTFVRSIEEDLARRDFTINAMAWSPGDRRFLDPFDGLVDLAAGRIRAVGDPRIRFREDGLRPFRGVRLAVTLGFDIEPETLAAIPDAHGESARVAPERLREELDRMLAGEHPSRGLELMRRTGLLEILIPELLEGVGCWQNRWHSYDVYAHALSVLDAAPRGKPVVRLAALLHDVGKPRTRVIVNGEGTFYNHQHVGAAMARTILGRLRYSGETIEQVVRLVDQHMFHYQPGWSDAAVRRFIRKAGAGAIADLFDLRIADALGKGPDSFFPADIRELQARVETELARGNALTIRDLAIDGATIMKTLGIGPGPAVGKALEHLLGRVLEDPGANRPERLLEILRDDYNLTP